MNESIPNLDILSSNLDQNSPGADLSVSPAPVTEAERLKLIDALRGVAVMGILIVNIPSFSMPDYFSESFRSNPRTLNFWLSAVIEIFIEGKMRAMFGMLFGAGVVLFVTKGEKAGKSVTGLFYRRMFWLVVFGLIHSHLILWIGDILYLYGLCGMLIYLVRNVKSSYLCLGIPLVGLLSFGSGVIVYTYVRSLRLDYVDAKRAEAEAENVQLSEKQSKALANWREIEEKFIPNRDDARENTRKMKSNYSTVAARLRPMAFDFQTKFILFEIWDSIALMLLGIALYRRGYLQGNWSNQSYLNMMLFGYGIGLPLVTFSFYQGFLHHPNLEATLARMEQVPVDWVGLIYPFQRILLVLAHSSAIILLDKANVAPQLFRGLTAVGRMAFTNYIMQSVICTLFFFGYGLSFFAELDFYQIYFVVLAIWTLQLFLSPLWLTYFQFGPLEWLWRSLTYLNVQPLTRTAALSIA
jgi:uncharacterized protein